MGEVGDAPREGRREREVARSVGGRQRLHEPLALAGEVHVVAKAAAVRAGVPHLVLGSALESDGLAEQDLRGHLQPQRNGARRQEHHGRVDRLEVERHDAIVDRVGVAKERVRLRPVVTVLRGPDRVVQRAGPRVAVVGVERGAPQAEGQARRRRLGQVLHLEAQRHRGIVTQHADLAEVHVLREADHAPGPRMTEEQEGQSDAREQDEEDRREEQNGDREQARGGEEAAPDHASAAQDARDVDGKTGAIARTLAVVSFDLSPQVAEDERAGSDDEESEEAEAVGQASAQHGPGHEMEQREDDDLLVVRGAAARGEADHLEEGRELDRDVEREATGKETSAFDRKEHERRGRREAAHRGAPLLVFRDRDGDGKADQERHVRPEAQRRRAHDREDAEHREGVRHHAVDEAEPHSAASCAGVGGEVTGSSRAR